MSISLQGFNCKYATFSCEGDIAPGALVNVNKKGNVAGATTGAFTGVAVSCHKGNVLVQLTGYATVAFTNSPALSYGYQTVVAGAGSKLVSAAAGRGVVVVDIDTTAGLAGIIL